MPFKFVEHTADVGILATGETLEEAIGSTALGMFSFISDLTGVEELETLEVRFQGNNHEELLFNFLDDLLYRFEVNNFLAKRVLVKTCTKRLLEAVVYGEERDKSHRIKREVKGVTYHRLKIEQPKSGGWRIQVYFDI